MIKIIVKYFTLWAILGCVFAYFFPYLFVDMKYLITYIIAYIMFGMGVTLEFSDFTTLFKNPRPIVLGVLMHFTIMPTIPWIMSMTLDLDPAIAAGLILVGCCPTGVSSELITYMAKGNVALAILITTCSNLCATVFTPLLTWLLAGKLIEVNVISMMMDIIPMIIIPVFVGLFVNKFFGEKLHKFKEMLPVSIVAVIVLALAIIVSANHQNLNKIGPLVVGCVIIHNLSGLTIGYYLAKFFKFNERDSRTLAIEVGMQNASLGMALAMKYFSPLAAVPGAIFAIWHNVSGSLLASYWSKKQLSDDAAYALERAETEQHSPLL